MIASDAKPPTYPTGLMVVVGVEPILRLLATNGADAALRLDHLFPLRQRQPVRPA